MLLVFFVKKIVNFVIHILFRGQYLKNYGKIILVNLYVLIQIKIPESGIIQMTGQNICYVAHVKK